MSATKVISRLLIEKAATGRIVTVHPVTNLFTGGAAVGERHAFTSFDELLAWLGRQVVPADAAP